MRISVVMCTYNGARYVEEQLSSILLQRRPPDEVVIRDDASTDDTVARIRAMTLDARLPVRLIAADTNIGVTANFSAALAEAKGDVLFLSDQDDVWMPDKLGLMARRFTDDTTTAAFSDGQVVDGGGRPLGYSLWQWARFTGSEQACVQQGDALPVFLRRNVAAGAVMAIHRRLLDIAQPFPPVGLHDEWLGLIAAASGRVALETTTLIRYRHHDANVVGAPRPRALDRLRSARSSDNEGRLRGQIRLIMALRERLLERRVLHPDADASLRGKLAHLQRRIDACRRPWHARAAMLAKEFAGGGYHRFADPRHAVRDLLSRQSSAYTDMGSTPSSLEPK